MFYGNFNLIFFKNGRLHHKSAASNYLSNVLEFFKPETILLVELMF